MEINPFLISRMIKIWLKFPDLCINNYSSKYCMPNASSQQEIESDRESLIMPFRLAALSWSLEVALM